MAIRGDLVELSIDKPAAGGRMIARLDGQVTLVAGAIPGERVRARLEGRRGGAMFASVVEVLEASADRRAAGDDPACGGRDFAHIVPERQRALKVEILRDAFRRLARQELTGDIAVHASPEDGYRMRARLHIRDGVVGFYREGTHELCNPACSQQLRDDTVGVVADVSERLKRASVLSAGTMELSENRDASERAVSLELSATTAEAKIRPLLDLPGVTGIGVIAGGQPVAVAGSATVADTLLLRAGDGVDRHVRLQRHVNAFFQGNRYLLHELAERVVQCLPEGPMADLYAGVGLFGVAHAALGRGDVIAVEHDVTGVGDLRANAAPYSSTFRVLNQPVEHVVGDARAIGGRTLLVDPPRTGLSRAVVAGICSARPTHLTYLSCDVATLARDVAALTAAGFGVVSADVFDLFPGTAHVETLVSMRRGD